MKSSFQIILTFILGFIGVIAVLMFAGILPGGIGPLGGKTAEEVVMWGPYKSKALDDFFLGFNTENKTSVTIKYESQTPETYENNLIESFARGEGPDLFFADQKMLNRLSGKLAEIPYTAYPQRDILNNFSDGVSVFMTSKGLKAVPLFIDPLVMYYNRTMYTSANIVIPPKNWTEFLATIKPIVEIDGRNNITRTAAALGEFRNITNAKYILSALMFQAGNPLVTTNVDDSYQSVLANDFGFKPTPAESAISFYQQFSNPAQLAYSWNRSLSSDKDMFISENLATYFGFASELSDLQAKNPHLNLDAVVIPQKDPQKRVTYGNFYGAVVAKNSKKQTSAMSAAIILSRSANQKVLAEALLYVPTRRDLLATKDANPLVQIFKDSAVIARSWVDPDVAQTNAIYQQMLEGIQTGQTNVLESITSASNKIMLLFSAL